MVLSVRRVRVRGSSGIGKLTVIQITPIDDYCNVRLNILS
jgi:hypothetical protein